MGTNEDDDVEDDEINESDDLDEDTNEGEENAIDKPFENGYIFNENILRQRHGAYITGNNIRIGRAQFTVDLVVNSALDLKGSNPQLTSQQLIDKFFAYFQT